MTRLPGLTGRDLLSALARLGFVVVRIKGSHHVLQHEDGRRTVVPVHAGETIGRGLLAKILSDCEIDRDQLLRAIGN
jgi:predicted RNA binding protein YcfA (HicA-like mRNA interferase family)